jgi:hypothetical protein
MRIEKEYAKTGYFWLPERIENKIPGILTIKDGGDIELEVVGSFDISPTEFKDFDNINRIIGHIEDDGFVTLDNCFYIKQNFSFGGISKSKILANQVYSGVAYDENEEIIFNTLSFSVDCIDEWVGISGFTNERYFDLKTTTINYTLPENIIFQLDKEMQLEICFTSTISQSTTEVKITQNTYFKLKSETLKPLSDFRDIVYKLTNFMCFAIDEIVSIKNMFATSSEIQREMLKEKSYPIPIHIYYKSNSYSKKIPNISQHKMLLTYETIRSNAQDVFNNWLNAYEILSPAINLYFSTKTNSYKYLEGAFLALAQGLETYHRRTSDEILMDSNKFHSLVADIIETCPLEQQEWLRIRLQYGNEISFSKRIQHIIEPFKSKLGNYKQRIKLIRKIVDTRNYFTHYNEDLKDKVAIKGNDLWFLCDTMEVIFQLHFLKVIGLKDEEIDNVIENNYPLKEKLNKILKDFIKEK